MVPDAIDPDAERRLQVLEHHTELGSGYRVALKDLELRGAGNLLGPEQSGFVHAVGFDMYLRMLEETVRRVMDGGGRPKLVPSDVPDGRRAGKGQKVVKRGGVAALKRPDEVA